MFLDDIFSALWILAYLAVCAMNAFIAHEKGRNEAAALGVSIFLTPVLPYLYLLAVPPLPKK